MGRKRGRGKKVSRASGGLALYVSHEGIPEAMPGPPSARERAIRGLVWCVRGLVGFVLLMVVAAAGLLAMVPLYSLPSPNLYQTGQLENALGALSAVLLVLGVGCGLMYAVGLAGLYGPRKELGAAHAASVVKTRLWLAATMVLLAVEVLVPSLTFPLLTIPGVGYVPPSWAWSVSVVLAGLAAISAGLTLYYAVQGFAQEDERVRLLLGMTLGVVSAIVLSGLTSYAAGLGGPSMDSLLPFLAGVLGGFGTSAISVGLFAAVYREIRGDLTAAAPA